VGQGRDRKSDAGWMVDPTAEAALDHESNTANAE